MQPVSMANATRYGWGGACDGWHLVQSEQLSVIQECMPPGSSEVAHLHRHAYQFFCVLEGEGIRVVEQQEIRLQSGNGIEIPPGVPRRFCNGSSRGVIFLVVSTPPSHGDRVLP